VAWALVGVISASLLATVPAAGAVDSGPPRPSVATADWDDGRQFRGVDGAIDPCTKSTSDICVDAAWIVSSSGALSPGRPFADGGVDAGWLYQFTTDLGTETYWLAVSRTNHKDPRVGPLAFMQVFAMEATTDTGGRVCPWSASEASRRWCVSPMRADLRFGMTLRSPLKSTGWMDGRLQDPRVDVVPPQGARPGLVTVEGTAIRLPTLEAEFDYDIPQDRAAWSELVAVATQPTRDSEGIVPHDWGTPGVTFYSASFPARAPYTYNRLSRALAPRLSQATGWTTVWRVDGAFLSDTAKRVTECDGIFNGLTTSDAMTYGRYAEWDAFTRELTFTMAGPTFTPEGSRLTGDFSMVLTERAASCLWKDSDNITDKVRVEVNDADGVEVAATVSVTRKDGQIRIEARGFGFSLKQASVAQIANGAPAAPTRVRTSVRGTDLTVTWPAIRGLSYRMRVTTGNGDLSRVVRQLTTRKGSVALAGLAQGRYRIELIAVNGQGQSPTTVRVAAIG